MRRCCIKAQCERLYRYIISGGLHCIRTALCTVMKLLSGTLFLCLALGLTNAAPTHHEGHHEAVAEEHVHDPALPDRCAGIEFDAIAPDEKGHIFFFKGEHLWKGFSAGAHLSNESFKELDDAHHCGHVNAAFRMHSEDHPMDHDHIYFFQDDKVFSYYNHTLEEGYPKEIQQDFPGVPSQLDAAVECPKGECVTDAVLFFKGHDVYSYDIATKTVKKKTWDHLPVCTSALRWQEHYYCFHGLNFTRFNQRTGEVEGNYPKETKNYFMRCSGSGHGGGYRVPKCSEVTLDAITSDDAGKTYAFKGPIYMRLDQSRDGMHAFPISRSWKEWSGGVDAAFSLTDKLYMIKGDQVYIYKSPAPYTLIEGYPKTLKEELGVEGPVDAAFVCAEEHVVHIIQGQKMLDVDLSATPRVVSREARLPFKIDAGLCGPKGVQVFAGSQYYLYASPMILSHSRIAPEPHPITSAIMPCQD